jgi:hypothetical protein
MIQLKKIKHTVNFSLEIYLKMKGSQMLEIKRWRKKNYTKTKTHKIVCMNIKGGLFGGNQWREKGEGDGVNMIKVHLYTCMKVA